MRRGTSCCSAASMRPPPERSGLSIALHTTPGVPEFLEPEIALVTAGVETDVLGIGRDDLSPEALRPSPPRIPDLTSRAGSCGRSQTATSTGRGPPSATSTPTCLEHFDNSFVRDDFVDIILNNSWPE